MDDAFIMIVILNTVICGYVAIDIVGEGLEWLGRYWNNG